MGFERNCMDARLVKRRSAFIEAAREAFLSEGFERTTLAQVVERAGGSLATLYKLFGSKEGLLTAVVEETTVSGEEIVRDVSALGLSLRDSLDLMAERFQQAFGESSSMALFRIVIARSLDNDDVVRGFCEEGMNRARDELAGFFARREEVSAIGIHSPEELASMFFAMICHDHLLQAVSGVKLDDAIDLSMRVQFFLRGATLV
jgi:AcrR family transcriptional regulator